MTVLKVCDHCGRSELDTSGSWLCDEAMEDIQAGDAQQQARITALEAEIKRLKTAAKMMHQENINLGNAVNWDLPGQWTLAAQAIKDVITEPYVDMAGAARRALESEGDGLGTDGRTR